MGKKRIVTGQRIDPKKLKRAKELRKNMTPAERRLWKCLRANRLDGWHFRRQQIIAGLIVDFYCHKAGLVIEVDGPIHAQQQTEDAVREKILSEHGLKVLRFTNQEVMNNLNHVLQNISSQLKSPLPGGKGLGDRSNTQRCLDRFLRYQIILQSQRSRLGAISHF